MGGDVTPIDKLGLLAPYIALAVVFAAGAVGSMYAWKRWRRKSIVAKP